MYRAHVDLTLLSYYTISESVRICSRASYDVKRLARSQPSEPNIGVSQSISAQGPGIRQEIEAESIYELRKIECNALNMGTWNMKLKKRRHESAPCQDHLRICCRVSSNSQPRRLRAESG